MYLTINLDEFRLKIDLVKFFLFIGLNYN
jgi:hypothetical protein